ncbi:hypothetical protein NYQ35_14015 [Curtobacterium flaccumfaciens pv. flaccumfaciens]|uniref:hypothetical protein n=1 Tax=Curtobacterium flaccumfaciens TaxID=2035 RepID=UPI00217F07CF|nr:hypothetical protein [Curtobacterium flaccumfaciens]MCS6569923.1 hypothetical protein [Curtobacterium flaccumfaciens pv. flaccumfaciens]MCS6586135.1 hypothetical protein [Curtobacterium flaccumfaciens pv. flaccumfaciens]
METALIAACIAAGAAIVAAVVSRFGAFQGRRTSERTGVVTVSTRVTWWWRRTRRVLR